MIEKTVIINRAISGSGKTTITNCILKKLLDNKLTVAVHSTDDFFMLNEKYIFDFNKLKDYHKKNFQNFQKSIKSNLDVVICDNTNISSWETEPYIKIAREYNYKILIITLNPRELKEHIVSQQVTKENPTAHGVSEDTLKNMIHRYYLFDDLLNPNIVIDPKKHINYTWDTEKKERVNISVSKHFDSDSIIRITPDEFKESQLTIGKKILNILENGE